jgi:5-methylcytosine-specific restriction endonuclease McrA
LHGDIGRGVTPFKIHSLCGKYLLLFKKRYILQKGPTLKKGLICVFLQSEFNLMYGKKKADRYVKYPSVEEYKHIWNSGGQDGFHECVNFKNFNGKIKGYVPPRGASLPEDEKFGLIFLTSKANKKESINCNLYDSIIGIQVGCFKTSSPSVRDDVPIVLKRYLKRHATPLEYHYTVLYDNSILLENPIEEASELIFPKEKNDGKVWMQAPGPVREIKPSHLPEVLTKIDISIRKTSSYAKWNHIKEKFLLQVQPTLDAIENENYREVSKIIREKKLSDFDFSSNIRKYPVESRKKILYYDRDPDVVAGALLYANGVCQGCNTKGPFKRDSDGKPYLEVHHIQPLSEGGSDSFDNVCALCPNCHKLLHLGTKDERYEEIMNNIKEMLKKRKAGK